MRHDVTAVRKIFWVANRVKATFTFSAFTSQKATSQQNFIMVKTCAVPNCKRKWVSGDSTPYYRFPKNEELREKWMRVIFGANNRPQLESLDSKRVCGHHFISGKRSKSNDHPDFVPSIFTDNDSESAQPSSCQIQKVERFERLSKRKSFEENNNANDIIICENTGTVEINDESVCAEEVTVTVNAPNKSTLYDKIRELEEKNKLLEKKNEELTNNLVSLEKQLSYYKYDENFFCNDDDKVQFYTGLPNFKVLQSVFSI